MSEEARSALLVGWGFVGLGLVLVFIGLLLFRRTKAFLMTAQTVGGTVVRIDQSEDSEDGTSYAPVIQYTTPDGQTHEFTPGVSTGSPRHTPGQAIQVRYDPQNPSKARVSTGFYLWFAPVLMTALGAVFGIVGAVLLFIV